MNVITISREFGSGGRELGQRLASLLGYNYYDKEIISIIAERHGLDEKYVEHALTSQNWLTLPHTFAHSFTTPIAIRAPRTDLLLEQKHIIEEIAQEGKDFIVVGRNSDLLLKDYKPLNIFVCADLSARIKRCQERAEPNEDTSIKNVKRNILRIDKNRKRTRYLLSEKDWGDRRTYHLIVNTTDWDIKELAESVADFAKRFFNQNK